MTSYRVTNPTEFEDWVEDNHKREYYDWLDGAAEWCDLPEYMLRNEYAIVQEWEEYAKTQ